MPRNSFECVGALVNFDISLGDDSVNSIGQSTTAASCCISNPSPARGG